jgi:nicotinamide-nucleotide amidase
MGIPSELTGPAHDIAKRLVARGETLSVCESSAGGLISAALLSYPGASKFYIGGTVIYTPSGVKAQLGSSPVPRPDPVRGASEPWARYLAAAVREQLGTSWSVSETGATGPTGNPYGDPPGHTWVAVASHDGSIVTRNILTGDDDREANMVAFAAAGLNLLLASLSGCC